ncbi:family 1 glycosylhydrolase [Bdellovibrio bacteriovorus]|uniref:family 1 glycosylhydrolase n=1 Tax=Bdellovibrio bacteriovorus TaxID=959 RepID=UPI0035A5C1B0
MECTLNRVGNRYFNQLDYNGHLLRDSDLDMFAQLGAQRIRYPCVWEQVSSKEGVYSWQGMDQRLDALRKRGLVPIAGLLHHGSGPLFTNLLDPQFPEKFARYARDFATRYPWINDYTPINEILTTSRFSCLYGHWFPHRHDDRSFTKALYLQCKATSLAMQEIRKTNPQARLIQTEDMGRVESTELLRYQRDFENNRRWLSFDLLMGKVDSSHPLYTYIKNGVTDAELKWLQDNPCVPDILGINHYQLSNRYLDEHLEYYPSFLHGGNHLHAYADVGAIDTGQLVSASPYEIFKEVWERYKLPLAVTEAHTRGYREDQMLWLSEIWQAMTKLLAEGADVRAVTAWSLLGTYNWNSLCTRDERFYEPGVFDLRTPDGRPRPTVLTKMVKSLSETGSFEHPLLNESVRWRNPSRALYAPASLYSELSIPTKNRKAVLITGGRGTLGRAFARVCALRNIPYFLLDRSQMDITNREKVREALDDIKPWAVINAAGYVKVDRAEFEALKCFKENVEGPRILAEECAKDGVAFLTFSSDMVFDGLQENPYLESSRVSPLNVYGRSKAQAEEKVLKAHESALVVRTSSFFGPWDEYNFITRCLKTVNRNLNFYAPQDTKVSPTYVPDLVNASLDLLVDQEKGLIHLTNDADVSWSDFAAMAVSHLPENKSDYIIKKSYQELGAVARRPVHSSLSSERFRILPPLEEALERYFQQLEIAIL